MTYLDVPLNIGTTSTTTTTTVGNINFNSLYTNSTTITLNTIPAAIQITNPSTNLPSVTIHHDGVVEYKGKPSQAAEAFYKALGGNIDIRAAGKNALEKTYRRAIERCLRQAKSMSKDDFISMLENELDARTSKAVLMRLSEDENDSK